MLKYHIKITDNETGEAIEDDDLLCFFGGIATAKGVKECALSHAAKNFQTAAAVIAANNVIEMVVTHGGEKMKELIQAMLEARGERE